MLCACSSVYAESRILPPVIDNSTYPEGVSQGSASSSANAMYEVLGRVEQLQMEVQQLRGVVEEQSQTIVDLKKRQGNIYSDLDLRLQEIMRKKRAYVEGGAGEATDLIIPVSPGSGLSVKERAASEQTIQRVASVIVDEPKSVVVGDKQRYQAAYEMLRNGHNRRAISEFKALLVASPKGEFADNSQYWLGEAYKVTQDLESAKQAFLKVVTEYAGSSKIPDAFLKLGYIEFEQKNMTQAREYLTQITVAYPETTAAHLAAKKLMQMRTMQF